MYAITTISKVL